MLADMYMQGLGRERDVDAVRRTFGHLHSGGDHQETSLPDVSAHGSEAHGSEFLTDTLNDVVVL